jgi:hypothetical protein
MYNHAGVLGTGTAIGSLPFTGFNSLWLGLAGFALVTAGTAILRIIPKREG